MRERIFDIEDEIAAKRNQLVDALEKRLQQKTSLKELFTIRWRRINEVLTGKGQDTGLLDKDNNDIFAGSFDYLIKAMNAGETVENLYQNILVRLFNNGAGGNLTLDRIKGESGEIALRVGTADSLV